MIARMIGTMITAARFGHTTSVEFIAINDFFQLGYLNGFVEYFVQRGYVRGKTIRAATYDWRHAAGMYHGQSFKFVLNEH